MEGEEHTGNCPKFEVFAISEEGTEVIDTANTERDAMTLIVRLLVALKEAEWKNDTDLINVIGFNYRAVKANKGED